MKLQQVLNILALDTKLYMRNKKFSSNSAVVNFHLKEEHTRSVLLTNIISIPMDVFNLKKFLKT